MTLIALISCIFSANAQADSTEKGNMNDRFAPEKITRIEYTLVNLGDIATTLTITPNSITYSASYFKYSKIIETREYKEKTTSTLWRILTNDFNLKAFKKIESYSEIPGDVRGQTIKYSITTTHGEFSFTNARWGKGSIRKVAQHLANIGILSDVCDERGSVLSIE